MILLSKSEQFVKSALAIGKKQKTNSASNRKTNMGVLRFSKNKPTIESDGV